MILVADVCFMNQYFIDGALDLRVVEKSGCGGTGQCEWVLVDATGECASCLSGHLNVQERNVAISVMIHSELDAAVYLVEVFQEEHELVLSLLPDEEGIANVM